jgi:hypothetical protein
MDARVPGRPPSPPTEDGQPILLQGPLRKQGRAGLKSWKSLFLQQEGSRLLIYEKEVLHGVIDLRKIAAVTRSRPTYSFNIMTNERTYIFSPVAPNEEQVIDYWVTGINNWLAEFGSWVSSVFPRLHHS